jgi:hypothetical protein
LSLLILLHFLAILTAVTSAPSQGFPAPALARYANRFFQPYLQGTFLANSYRFYAPNPGTPSILWFRIQYQDRTVRWLEMPRRDDFVFRMAYERYKSLANLLSQHVAPGPTGRLEISELGQIGLASYVRHVTRTLERIGAEGFALPVREIGLYSVQHAPREPAQIRAGWEPDDLRTYRAVFLGAYNAQGKRTDEYRPAMVEQPMAFVVAGILVIDVLPSLKNDPASGPLSHLERLSLPGAVRRLIIRFPELLSTSVPKADLQEHIEQLMAGARL